MLLFGKDEAVKLSGLKISSNSSPQKSFSRSSSRLSFQDDYDDSVFSGPFVVDDDDVTDPGSRYFIGFLYFAQPLQLFVNACLISI